MHNSAMKILLSEVFVFSFLFVLIIDGVAVAEFCPDLYSHWLYVGGHGPNNYTSIQSAIDDADDGDTIYVYPGIYYETLNINKSINLIGENKYSTIIDGLKKSEVIKNTDPVNHLTISGFTIRNGIYGIGLYSCNGVIIRDNIICNNRYAGIWLDNSENCLIYDNTIQENRFYNIWLGYESNNNTIRDNSIKRSYTGVYIVCSYKNKIVNNNFIENSIHASFKDTLDNQWDGNYWDDWIGLRFRFLKMLPKLIIGYFKGFLYLNFDHHPAYRMYHYYSVLYVGGKGDGNYSSIQDAIDDANDGDLIYVFHGIYFENLYINKSITIVGENQNNTIVDGRGIGSVFEINGKDVTISNFTIRNGSYGITLFLSNKSTIYNNIIKDNKYDGIWLDLSDDNLICNNVLWGNGYNGILLVESDRNKVEKNIVRDNGIGINVGYSTGNIISNNDFINNRINAYFISSHTHWEGNYWDNWIGVKLKLLRCFPKIIIGKSIERGRIAINFDWHPSMQPHTINI